MGMKDRRSRLNYLISKFIQLIKRGKVKGPLFSPRKAQPRYGISNKMRTLLIALSTLTIFSGQALAGVGVVTPQIEAEAYALWNKFCEGQSDGGNDPATGVVVFCKKPRGSIRQNFQHEVNINPQNAPTEQVVFVKPPSYHYKHDVIIKGGGVSARKTVIYVKPAKNTHEVNVQDQTVPNQEAQKPTLFFLKGNHGQEEETGAVPQTTPDNTYLPPTTQKPGYQYGQP